MRHQGDTIGGCNGSEGRLVTADGAIVEPGDFEPAGTDSVTRRSADPRAQSTPTGQTFDVERVRADFPSLNQEVRPGVPLIYLDSAATSLKPSAGRAGGARITWRNTPPTSTGACTP